MVVFLAGGVGMVLAQGFPGRFPQKALQIASVLNTHQEILSMRTGTCFITTDYNFEKYDSSTCLHQDEDKKNYLLIGDSHSAMLWSALATKLKDSIVMQASTANCPLSLSRSGTEDCGKMMSYIFERYLPTHRVDGLFLVARWEQANLDSLTKLISWAKTRRLPVIVFGPVPEYDAPLPRLLAYSIAWNRPGSATQHQVVGPRLLDTEMQQIAATN